MIGKVSMACVALVAIAPSAGAQVQKGDVKVEQGMLRGTTQGGVSTFLGIPYAAPPTGENRWRTPLPAAAWQGVRDATHFGASCQQDIVGGKLGFAAWTPEYLIEGPVSEDCLTLNVWAPAHKSGKRLPVLFWIHGGGFVSGGTTVPIYDGTHLATHGVVVVTVNYRLGIYGFLAHPELAKEGDGATGNYGLLDQIAGLVWVRRNIAAFGGDPAQVTIAGQSAGAGSVNDLVLSPRAKGLFRGAIAQSGSNASMYPMMRSVAEAAGLRLQKAAGATSLADLRKLMPEQLSAILRTSSAAMGFSPVADGVVLPADPAAALREGNYNKTPMLTGFVADEGSSGNAVYRPTTPEAYRRLVTQRYGAFSDKILAAYPAETPATSAPAQARDRTLAAMLAWANERSQTPGKPIYAYLFTHVEPGPEAAQYGAFHSSDIPYVFGTLNKAPERGFSAEDRAISRTVGRYWINFVKTGNPNGKTLAYWPVLDSRMRIMDLGPFKAIPALSEEHAKLFKAYIEQGGHWTFF